jgi:Cu(I)/Ag(I) efflux system protein CusF
MYKPFFRSQQRWFRALVIAACVLPITGVLGQIAWAEGQPATASRTAESNAADHYTVGEIRKVDTVQGKLTIRHDDIKNLGMPGMTMNFKVKDPAMLGQVQVGDAVRFVVERMNGALVITELHKAGQ